MNVSVLIPYRYSSPHKERLFAWVTSRLACTLQWTVVVAEGNLDGEFSRGKSINYAARLAKDADVFVICDADTIADPKFVHAAVDLATQGGWALPYTMYYNLDENETELTLKRPTTTHLSPPRNPIHSLNYVVSGMVAVSREAFESVGGFDERFIGWGYEDDAFVSSLMSLVGPIQRADGFVSHLWHEIENETGDPFDHPFIEHNRALGLRYKKAMRDTRTMEALIAERR